ncbi:MAG: hypothetical protein ABI621_12390 [Chloroflexota bacterium]
MSTPLLVQMVGAPIACQDGVKDSWRDVSTWAAGQLRARFGNDVLVKYYDLFDADCPPVPANAQLPLVIIDGEVVSSGGKISVPVIRRKVASILAEEIT